MRSQSAEKALTGLLRFLGALTLLAVFAAIMPTTWMSAANDSLGLAPLDRSPLMEYLTRSLSAIYALLGALTLYVAGDVKRYADFVAFAGGLTILFGLFLTMLGGWADLPAAWVWFEGPPTMFLGGLMFWLARQVGDSPERRR